MTCLKVDQLHVYYGNIHAIKGISMEVNQGEVVTLIGANGAGKTTTLQTISGLLHPKKGNIYFQDKEITKEKNHMISRGGLVQVPEGRRIFQGMSVVDNLKLGAFFCALAPMEEEKRLQYIYDLFPVLEERKNQKAGTLSGGEQQMLAMGRALMSKPKLLLLDEPSMGLSPLFVEKIFEVILELKKQGCTILLVEQNANLALTVADRGYVLETGSVVKEGAAKELKNDSSIKEAYLGG